jgi:hypothetical protein
MNGIDFHLVCIHIGLSKEGRVPSFFVHQAEVSIASHVGEWENGFAFNNLTAK